MFLEKCKNILQEIDPFGYILLNIPLYNLLIFLSNFIES